MLNGFPIAVQMGLGEAGITAIFGYIVVFIGLALLMALIYIIGSIFQAKDRNVQTAAKTAAPTVKAMPETIPEAKLAPGSAGHVKLYDVPDKEAAMVMAVVAYKMQKPLNELRFISIKEVKKDEV